jgi:hypothetical protein
MKTLKGLKAEIYQASFVDALSPIKESKQVTIIDKDLPEIFEASQDSPPVRIVKRLINGETYIHAEPYERGNYAAGGRFIYTSDSRLREISKYPIPLHDRDMSKEIR